MFQITNLDPIREQFFISRPIWVYNAFRWTNYKCAKDVYYIEKYFFSLCNKKRERERENLKIVSKTNEISWRLGLPIWETCVDCLHTTCMLFVAINATEQLSHSRHVKQTFNNFVVKKYISRVVMKRISFILCMDLCFLDRNHLIIM